MNFTPHRTSWPKHLLAVVIALTVCLRPEATPTVWGQEQRIELDPVAEGFAPKQFDRFSIAAFSSCDVLRGRGSLHVGYIDLDSGRGFKARVKWIERGTSDKTLVRTYHPSGFGSQGFERPPFPDRQTAIVELGEIYAKQYRSWSPTHAIEVEINETNSQRSHLLDKRFLDRFSNELMRRVSRRALPYPEVLLALQLPSEFQGHQLGSVRFSQADEYGRAEIAASYRHPNVKNRISMSMRFSFVPRGSAQQQRDWRLDQATSENVLSRSRLLGVNCDVNGETGLGIGSVRELARRLIPSLEPFAAMRPRSDGTKTHATSSTQRATNTETGPFASGRSKPRSNALSSPNGGSTPLEVDGQTDAGVTFVNDGAGYRDSETRLTVSQATAAMGLASLILATMATGLSLSQAIAVAIADAVRAGIEVTGQDVTEAIVEAIAVDPIQPVSTEQIRAEQTFADGEDSFQPNAPTVPGTLTEGDESVPFRGIRENVDGARRALFGERDLHGKSSSSLTEDHRAPFENPFADEPSTEAEPTKTVAADGSDRTQTRDDVPQRPKDPNQRIEPDAEPVNPYSLKDPETGERLRRDVNGRVRYGDEWMSPEEAKRRTDIDTEAIRRGVEASNRVDDFKTAVERAQQETDPERRIFFEAEVRRQANEFLGDYDGRTTLKAEGRNPYSEALDNAIQEINRGVDRAHMDEMNAMGLALGGQPFDADSLIDFRNRASLGTVPTDRDRGLNETEYRNALDAVNQAQPGSQEAYEATHRLAEARRRSQITIDPNKYDDYLRQQNADIDVEHEAITQQLAALPEDSPQRQALEQRRQQIEDAIRPDLSRRRADLDGLTARHQALMEAKVEELNRALGKHPTDSPEANRIRQTIAELETPRPIPISKSRWGELAQTSYDRVFEQQTGKSSRGALQATTHSGDKEAFGDRNVLLGVSADNLPNPDYASQTASVANVKSTENQHLMHEGHFTEGQAIKETARGYAKDLGTKVMPLIESDPKIKPERVNQLRRIHEVLDAAGKGEILPGQVDMKLRQAVPEIPNMDLGKATAMVDANFEAAIRWRTPEPKMSAGDVFGNVSDLHGTLDEYNKLRAKGANAADAAGTAAAKTAMGNAIYADQPGIGMAGALLPTEARVVLPDQFVGELLDSSRSLLAAAAKDVGNATVTGQLSAEQYRLAAQDIADRGGTVGGYGRIGAFLGDEAARAAQQDPNSGIVDTAGRMASNLYDDIGRMHRTGVLAEVAAEAKENASRYITEDIAPSALEGKHGAPIQGYMQTAQLFSEIVRDPQQFAEDSEALSKEGWIIDREGNVGNGLLFDRELQRQVSTNVDQVLSNSPIVNVPYTGLRDIGRTAFDPEFRQQMSEGASGLSHELGEFLFGGWVNKADGSE